jgi:acetyl-CoA synthetase
LYVTALGTLKYTAVFLSLFSVFGPEPIYQRVSKGDVTILITTLNLYERKVKLVERPHFAISFLRMQPNICRQNTILSTLMEQASTDFKIPKQTEDALLHFTSGTTGMPKAFYVHHAVLPIT